MPERSTGRRDGTRRARMLNLGESVMGTAGALLVTYALCFLLAMAVLWVANRIISIGGLHGTLPTAIIALVLTVLCYLYDRDHLSP